MDITENNHMGKKQNSTLNLDLSHNWRTGSLDKLGTQMSALLYGWWMKTAFALLIPLMFISINTLAQTATTQPASKKVYHEGFKAAPWGSTAAEMKKLYPKIKQQGTGNSQLTLQTTFSRIPSKAAFHMKDGKLAKWQGM